MNTRSPQSVSSPALVVAAIILSLGLAGDMSVGSWVIYPGFRERVAGEHHSRLVAQWLKGLSQAARHLHRHDSTTVIAVTLCLRSQLAVSLEATPNLFVEASHARPQRPPILASLTNLPPPCV